MSIPRTVCSCKAQEGYQLTWMDAKMGDWVVTPRRGKAVEINALWFNALSLLAVGCGKSDECRRGTALRGNMRNARAFRSTNASGSRKADIFTMSSMCNEQPGTTILPAGPTRFSPSRSIILFWIKRAGILSSMLCRRSLLTPVGLRSLSPKHPEYKPIYGGDLRSRDGAYHQGTVWAWLIGPFIDAWLKVHPGDKAGARKFLEVFPDHLSDNGLGTISEVFDAREPHMSGGCIAQAWSVAEVLRCWVKTT